MAEPSGKWIVRDLQTTQSDVYVEIKPAQSALNWTYTSYMRCTRPDGSLREGLFDEGIVRCAKADGDKFIFNSTRSQIHGIFGHENGTWTWESLSEPVSGPLVPGWPDAYPACKS